MFSIRVISNLDEARKVWDLLSPRGNIYEEWDFRFVFYKYFSNPLRFYVAEEDGETVGLLPLQFNAEKNHLEFFGGNFMEDNHAFIKSGYEKCIPELYAAVKERARLEDIILDNEFVSLQFLENKYVIDLEEFGDIDSYLNKTFSSKTRKKIKKRNEEIELLGPEIACNEDSDLDVLIDLNKQAFGKDSSFHKPFRREIWQDILKSDFETVTLSAKIDGKKRNASLAVVYKDTFVSLAVGNDKEDFPNLGTYMLLERIKKAISLKCKTFDAGLNDLGWKNKWHLRKIPQYIFSVDI